MTDPQIVEIVQLAAMLSVFLLALGFIGQTFERVSPEEKPAPPPRRVEAAVHCRAGRHNVPPDQAVWNFEIGWECRTCRWKAQVGSFRPNGAA